MNRLAACIALATACSVAHAVAVPSYVTRVDVAADGQGQAVVQLTIAEASAGVLLVPLAPSLKPAGPVRLDGAPLGAQLKTITIADRPHLELVLPEGVGQSLAVTASFPVKGVMAAPKPRAHGKRSVPEGSLLLDYSFVNTQPFTIGSYRAQVVLPEGNRVHEIREQSPKTKRTDIEPRVALNAIDGRQGALLQLGDVRQGDRASMSIEVIPDSRGWIWLTVGLLLSIGYLVGFRDLVSKTGTTPLPASDRPQFESKERHS
jgi:hypothetical protein